MTTAKIVDRLDWLRGQIDRLLPAGGTIVDIGCDNAPATMHRADTTWVDSRPLSAIVEGCEKASLEFGIEEARFVQASAEKLPFADKQFDVALLTEILEHVPEPIRVIEEAARAASVVIITVPNEYAWGEEQKPFNNPAHVRHYTRAMLERELSNAGFKNAEVGSLEYEGWAFWTAVLGVQHGGIVTKDTLAIMSERIRSHELLVPCEGRPTTERSTMTAGVWGQEASKKPVAVANPHALKIALVSSPMLPVPPAGYGGLERVIYDLAVALAKHGHTVTLFAPDGSSAEGCEVVTWGPAANQVACNWLEAEYKGIAAVQERLINGGFDIIHQHNWFGLCYGLRAQHPKLRVCTTMHGHLNIPWWTTSKSPFALNLLAISEHMKREFESQGFAARRVYNGVDLAKYRYKAEKGHRLLFVARLDKFKQPQIAIEVAKKLQMGLDLVAGTFVQSDEWAKGIMAQCDGTQIKCHIEPSQDLKVKLMMEAACLLSPSNMGEPFGLMNAEAMACGTPCVGFDDGAIKEVISDGVTGYVVPQGDVEAMCKAVKKCKGIRPGACRAHVEQHFTRKTMAANYEAAYRDIIAGREW